MYCHFAAQQLRDVSFSSWQQNDRTTLGTLPSLPTSSQSVQRALHNCKPHRVDSAVGPGRKCLQVPVKRQYARNPHAQER